MKVCKFPFWAFKSSFFSAPVLYHFDDPSIQMLKRLVSILLHHFTYRSFLSSWLSLLFLLFSSSLLMLLLPRMPPWTTHGSARSFWRRWRVSLVLLQLPLVFFTRSSNQALELNILRQLTLLLYVFLDVIFLVNIWTELWFGFPLLSTNVLSYHHHTNVLLIYHHFLFSGSLRWYSYQRNWIWLFLQAQRSHFLPS